MYERERERGRLGSLYSIYIRREDEKVYIDYLEKIIEKKIKEHTGTVRMRVFPELRTKPHGFDIRRRHW